MLGYFLQEIGLRFLTDNSVVIFNGNYQVQSYGFLDKV